MCTADYCWMYQQLKLGVKISRLHTAWSDCRCYQREFEKELGGIYVNCLSWCSRLKRSSQICRTECHCDVIHRTCTKSSDQIPLWGFPSIGKLNDQRASFKNANLGNVSCVKLCLRTFRRWRRWKQRGRRGTRLQRVDEQLHKTTATGSSWTAEKGNPI